jgi:hypothetical protein
MNEFKTQSSILIVMIGVAIMTLFIWYFWDESPINQMNKVQLAQQAISVKDVENWVHSLPESSFKSNMLTVLGAEYGGDSEELNKLMKAFIEVKMQELSTQKTI